MPVIDIHAHYVSPELIGEAARNGAHYGVKLQDDAEGKQRLVIADTAPLRPVFAELSDLSLRLPMLKAQGVDRQVISTWTDLAGDELGRKEERAGRGCRTRAWRRRRALCPNGSKPWVHYRCSIQIS
jgi:hypothetical protein